MVYFGSIYSMVLYYSTALYYFNCIISQNLSFANLHSNYLCCKRQTEFSPTFAIRAKKRSFLGIQRLETLDFTGVDFQKAL